MDNKSVQSTLKELQRKRDKANQKANSWNKAFVGSLVLDVVGLWSMVKNKETKLENTLFLAGAISSVAALGMESKHKSNAAGLDDAIRMIKENSTDSFEKETWQEKAKKEDCSCSEELTR